MTHRGRLLGGLVVAVLVVAVAGCASVGRLVIGDAPTPELAPVAMLPSAAPPATAPPPGAAATPPLATPTDTTPTVADDDPVGTPPPTQSAAAAATERALVAARVPQLIAVDGSAAMAEPVAGGTRQQLASYAVERLSLVLPDFVPVGLASFGDAGTAAADGRLESCSSVTTHAVPGELAAGAEDLAAAPGAVGWRPLAGMVDLAGPMLAAAQDRAGDSDAPSARMVVLTSGGDSCGEDVHAALDRLGDDAPTLDIIALDVSADDAAHLARVAQRTGGTLAVVRGREELAAAVDAIATRPAALVRSIACEVPGGTAPAGTPLAEARLAVEAARQRALDVYGRVAEAPTSGCGEDR